MRQFLHESNFLFHPIKGRRDEHPARFLVAFHRPLSFEHGFTKNLDGDELIVVVVVVTTFTAVRTTLARPRAPRVQVNWSVVMTVIVVLPRITAKNGVEFELNFLHNGRMNDKAVVVAAAAVVIADGCVRPVHPVDKKITPRGRRIAPRHAATALPSRLWQITQSHGILLLL